MTAQTDLTALDGYLTTAYTHSGDATNLLAAGNTKAAELHMVAVAYAIANAQNSAAALAVDIAPPPPPPPPPPTGTALNGLWNNGTPATTLGTNPQVIHDYGDGTYATTYTYNATRTAQQAGKRLLLSVGNCTPAQATAIANTLVANGQSNAIISPMWEMNTNIANWCPGWNEVAYTAAEYISVWTALRAAFKAVSAGFTFVWCINPGSPPQGSGRTVYDTFPGTAVCDVVGVDIYDTFGSVGGAQSGLAAIVAFAKSKGLPWAACEWGLANNVDDPAFVQMIQTASTDGTCFLQALFSEVGLTSGSGTDITKAPKSLAAYKAWLG